MDSFATAADLTAWLLGGDYEDQTPTGQPAERLLARATERIHWASYGTYLIDTLTGMPVDVAVAQALRDATCAQVEQWFEVGEENDIAGYPGETSMSAGAVSMTRQAAQLAPRAARILLDQGILNAQGAGAADDSVELPPIGVDII